MGTMAPIVRQFGWRTAALAQERAVERRMKEVSSASPKTDNLTVEGRIFARKQRVIAGLGSKVAAAVRGKHGEFVLLAFVRPPFCSLASLHRTFRCLLR